MAKVRHRVGLFRIDAPGSHFTEDALQCATHRPWIVESAHGHQRRRLRGKKARAPRLEPRMMRAQRGMLVGAQHPAAAPIAKREAAALLFQSLNLPIDNLSIMIPLPRGDDHNALKREGD